MPFLGSGPYEETVQAEDHNHQDRQTTLSPKHTEGIRAGCWTEPAGEAETGLEAAVSRGCRGRGEGERPDGHPGAGGITRGEPNGERREKEREKIREKKEKK